MARDIFNREIAYGNSFSSDGVRLTFGGQSGRGAAVPNFGQAGMLTQQLGCQYRQNIARIYEIGSPKIYVVAGRTQGQATLGRVIGPEPLGIAFYTAFGDACNMLNNNINLTFNSACNDGSSSALPSSFVGMHHCVIDSFGLASNANDMLFNEQLSLTFLMLAFQDSKAPRKGRQIRD
jgi:hypothetical protein